MVSQANYEVIVMVGVMQIDDRRFKACNGLGQVTCIVNTEIQAKPTLIH